MTEAMAEDVRRKIAELRRQRAQRPAGLVNFDRVQDLELTFTSNAIEGNTLTAVETTLVVEQGITIAGKPLRDHLEAIDLFEALRYVRRIAVDPLPIVERDVRQLHRLVMLRSAPDQAGGYADQGRYVLTDSGRHAFPSPPEIPALMGAFAAWLAASADTPETAFAAHLGLVRIHPFNDGNGRTARLLMNLVLIRAGAPPVAIGPQHRVAYLGALQSLDDTAFVRLMYRRLDETLDEYLAAAAANI